MKNMAQRGKTPIKMWGFGGYKREIVVEKIRAGNQTRKAKWCKMQVLGLKMDNPQDVKG
jgi:hypothetical protein